MAWTKLENYTQIFARGSVPNGDEPFRPPPTKHPEEFMLIWQPFQSSFCVKREEAARKGTRRVGWSLSGCDLIEKRQINHSRAPTSKRRETFERENFSMLAKLLRRRETRCESSRSAAALKLNANLRNNLCGSFRCDIRVASRVDTTHRLAVIIKH